jgi:hypothetical protein
MGPKFVKGQKITIVPVKNRPASPRDSDIEPYIGLTGQVTDYYWVCPRAGERAFYIYTVRIGESKKEVVVHEDEIEAFLE